MYKASGLLLETKDTIVFPLPTPATGPSDEHSRRTEQKINHKHFESGNLRQQSHLTVALLVHSFCADDPH